MSRPSYTIELALDARFAKDLAAGGVFVPARGFNVLDEIDLVVKGNAGELCLHARVVYIDPANGCGLELLGFGPEIKEQLAQIAVTPTELAAVAATKQRRKRVLTHSSKRKTRDSIEMIALDSEREVVDDGEDDCESDELDDAIADGEGLADTASDELDDNLDAGDGRAHRTDDDHESASHDLGIAASADEDAETATDDPAIARTKSGRIRLNSTERLRGLSLADQIKVARGPSASERMALERMYGKNVWEALLHNPALTTPEVARLARLGTLPRILLDIIVNNNTWLQVPEVRRALLANPRLGTDQIARVLRLLPKHELKLASTIPAYPQSVRSLAKKMIKDSD